MQIVSGGLASFSCKELYFGLKRSTCKLSTDVPQGFVNPSRFLPRLILIPTNNFGENRLGSFHIVVLSDRLSDIRQALWQENRPVGGGDSLSVNSNSLCHDDILLINTELKVQLRLIGILVILYKLNNWRELMLTCWWHQRKKRDLQVNRIYAPTSFWAKVHASHWCRETKRHWITENSDPPSEAAPWGQ